MLDEMIEGGSAICSEIIAKACLERARMRAKSDSRVQAALELKNLVLQRNLANEPIHLEAALEYTALLGDGIEKRLSLLQKIKSDFENGEDLIAQDYAQARLHLQEKNQVYQRYMQLIDAEILWIRSGLSKDFSEKRQFQENAMDLLIKMKEENADLLLGSQASSLFQKLTELALPEEATGDLAGEPDGIVECLNP